MDLEIEDLGTFEARSADGTIYTIHISQEVRIHRTMHGTVDRVPGLKSLQTSDGEAVNRIAKGQYEIVDLETIPITSDDPNAP